MLVWLSSWPRSGNTLLRMVLWRCFGQRTYSIYDDPEDIGADESLSNLVGHRPHAESPVEFAARAKSSEDLFLVKTHAPRPTSREKAIYVVRDGRAAMVSLRNFDSRYGRRPLSLHEIALGDAWVGSWAANVEAWGLTGSDDILVVHFEALTCGESTTLSRIGEFLQLEQREPFDINFDDSRSISPKFFGVGENEPGIQEVGETCPNLFNAINGSAMVRMGYLDTVPIDGPSLAKELRDYCLLRAETRAEHDAAR